MKKRLTAFLVDAGRADLAPDRRQRSYVPLDRAASIQRQSRRRRGIRQKEKESELISHALSGDGESRRRSFCMRDKQGKAGGTTVPAGLSNSMPSLHSAVWRSEALYQY